MIFMRLLMNVLAVLIAAYILPGVTVEGFWAALVTAVILGVFNTILRPILVFLTLPVTILSLGLSIFVINALLVLLASKVIPGFEVAGFWWALLFSMVTAIIGGFLGGMAKSDHRPQRPYDATGTRA